MLSQQVAERSQTRPNSLMQSILNLIMGAGFKIIGEAMIMQQELAASLSTAGEKVMDFPYCLTPWTRLGSNVATLLMKAILNFIEIAKFKIMRVTSMTHH